MTEHFSILKDVRQPEYTGHNRCYPCTIVNVILNVLISGATAILHPGLGSGLFLIGLLSIYLRGYLVPGTPKLTKKYLPKSILNLFDKTAPSDSSLVNASSGAESMEIGVDPEDLLDGSGILEKVGDDLRLDSSARSTLREIMGKVREKPSIYAARNFSVSKVSLRQTQNGLSVVHEDTEVAKWISEAAMIADIAIQQFLSQEIDSWCDYSIEQRGHVVSSLRIFLESCPKCDSDLELSNSEIETCCSVIRTNKYQCGQCNQTLLEYAS